MAKEFLNIVDDNDHIIGIEDRRLIHEKGLLHREVHVYFVMPDKKIIFQHRAKDKDMFPDLLDATVGGHVEIGESYEEAAVKEAFEETGFRIEAKDLIPVAKICKSSKDEVTGKTNHAFQQELVYVYMGKVEDLKIEEGKGLGFEIWDVAKFETMTGSEKSKFIPHIHNFVITKLNEWLKIKK